VSIATRKRISEAMRRMGHRPPAGELWKSSQDRLVCTLPPAGPDARCEPCITGEASWASPSQTSARGGADGESSLRFKLRFGPYAMPRPKIGQRVDCEYAGTIRVVAISDATVQWRKIAAARRGKPRPRWIIEAMAKARRGSKHTKATRAKMQAAHKRLGTRPVAECTLDRERRSARQDQTTGGSRQALGPHAVVGR
jgi:hypothetical protein